LWAEQACGLRRQTLVQLHLIMDPASGYLGLPRVTSGYLGL